MNSKRVIGAKSLNEGSFYQITGVDEREEFSTFRFNEGEINANRVHLNEIEVIFHRVWESSRLRIDRVEGDKVYFNGQPTRGYDSWISGRYYLENFIEGIGSPGE